MRLSTSVALSLLAAGLQVLAFPNFGLSILAWALVVPLLAVFDARGPLASFLLGALFGQLMALGITYWLYHAVVHYFGAPAYLGIALVAAACLYYAALYAGLFGLLVCLCRPLVRGPAGVWVVPCFWVTCEVLRASWLSENAWGLIGYSQYLRHPLMQVADVTGVYGVSFLVVMVNTALYQLLKRWSARRAARRSARAPADLRGLAGWRAAALPPVLILACVLVYGHLRTRQVDEAWRQEPRIRAAAVQGNIHREYRWKSIYYGKNLSKYVTLSRRPEALDADLLVWPENALNFHPDREALFLGIIRKVLSDPARPLLTGAPHMTVEPDGRKAFFNAAYLVTGEGIQGVYRKIHLMPFSERKPRWMTRHFGNPGEAPPAFSQGTEHTVFRLPAFSFAAPICFEMVYPEEIRSFVSNGAELLVNISNDSWFGPGAGPYQHLIFATVRAVENRRFVLRAANTGISAVISPTGRILDRTKLDETAVLSANVTPLKGLTFYSRHGDVFAALCALVTLCCAAGCLLRPLLRGTRTRKRRVR